MKKFIKYFAITSGLLLLVYLSFCAYFALQTFLYARSVSQIANKEPAQIQEEVQQNIGLKIVFGQGDERSYTYTPWQKQITAYDILIKAADENNIEIDAEQYDFGVFVRSIAGFENTNERAWIYFVNGESGQVSADNQEVNPGDLIEWKYIKPEF
jgi:hypothetical protein